MSSRHLLPNGFTLMEMVVTIVLFGVIAAVGSQLISKLVPSYLLSAQAQQSLSPREAALWRLSEDFRRALLVDATKQDNIMLPGNCMMSMVVASGVTGNDVVSHVVTYWLEDSLGVKQLWVSDLQVRGILLNNIRPRAGSGCPVSYTQTGCKGRMCLYVDFDYPDPDKSDVRIPVSTTLYSYVNGPYISSISPVSGLADGNNIAVSINGFFPVATGGWQRIDVISGTSMLFSKAPDTFSGTGLTTAISSTTSGVVDIRVVNPDGWSYLKQAFTFVSQ